MDAIKRQIKNTMEDKNNPLGLQWDRHTLVNSFSAVIEFHDKKIPHNKEILTDAKLLNLAVIAYNQMIEQGRSLKLPMK